MLFTKHPHRLIQKLIIHTRNFNKYVCIADPAALQDKITWIYHMLQCMRKKNKVVALCIFFDKLLEHPLIHLYMIAPARRQTVLGRRLNSHHFLIRIQAQVVPRRRTHFQNRRKIIPDCFHNKVELPAAPLFICIRLIQNVTILIKLKFGKILIPVCQLFFRKRVACK